MRNVDAVGSEEVVDEVIDCCCVFYLPRSTTASLKDTRLWIFDKNENTPNTPWKIVVRVCPQCVERPMLLLTHENHYARLVGKQIIKNTITR